MARKPKPSGRKTRKSYGRSVNTRELRQKILIVCEGKKTEPNYFGKFRGSHEIVTVPTGRNTIQVVQRALVERDKVKPAQTWCVFDKDDYPHEDFNEAIQMAQSNEIHVAYSNQAFELWYLLHFDYHNTAMNRSSYQERLSKLIRTLYEKNSENMFDLLLEHRERAVQFAKKLHNQYQPHHNPARDDPCTTVYRLVEQLMKFEPGAHRRSTRR